MWSDNETSVDLLQFKYLASGVVQIIRTPALLPTTLGVFGDWGSGKSSLLKMVQAEIESDEEIMTLNFSGWLFEGYEDAKTALMGTILDAIHDQALAKRTLGDKAKNLLQILQKRVNWMQLASLIGRYALPTFLGHPHLSLAMAGADLAKKVGSRTTDQDKGLPLEDFEKVLQKAPEGEENIRRNIRDFHSDFATLLTEAKIKTLVVFIDDLDRCLPDTIIETLEAIKLFLFVPGTVFILGADERLIQYAVRQRFPELPGTEAEVGRDYLEKLVQIPIRIPPLSGAEVHSYINLLFAQLRVPSQEYDVICAQIATFLPSDVAELSFDLPQARSLVTSVEALSNLEQDLDFTAQVAPVLTPGLNGNPRRTKRFLNSLLLRLSLGAARNLKLQRQVLAKLMLLEYLKPEFFRQLAVLQASQAGKPVEMNGIERVLRKTGSSDTPEPEQVSEELVPKQPAPKSTPTKVVSERPATDTYLETLPAELKAWLADSWMQTWLASEPELADTDLRPYFYIAHDKVGVFDGLQLRLSPAAVDVLTRLLDVQPATQAVGFARSANLSFADASAIFEALAKRVRQAETLSGANSPHKILFQLITYRRELLPQLIALLGTLPEQKIILAIPAQLYEIARSTESTQAAQELVGRWSRSSSPHLKEPASQTFKRDWTSKMQTVIDGKMP